MKLTMLKQRPVQISGAEKDLIIKVKSGDKEAYKQLIAGYCGQLYGYLFRMLGNHEDAEDILQEALTQAYSHMHQFKGDSQFCTWLYRIAINIACRHLRKRQLSHFKERVSLRQEHDFQTDRATSVDLASGQPDPLDQAEENELKQKVRAAIARLPERFAEVLTLKELEGLSYYDISSRIGIPRGTVMSRLHRGRLILAQRLKKLGLRPG